MPSFLALWWPKIDRKSGLPQLFAETVGSIHFIPGIYTYGVSLWTPIDFRPQWLKNKTICWVFLDGVGTDQSGGILSPFMGTACLHCLDICLFHLFLYLVWHRTPKAISCHQPSWCDPTINMPFDHDGQQVYCIYRRISVNKLIIPTSILGKSVLLIIILMGASITWDYCLYLIDFNRTLLFWVEYNTNAIHYTLYIFIYI